MAENFQILLLIQEHEQHYKGNDNIRDNQSITYLNYYTKCSPLFATQARIFLSISVNISEYLSSSL